MIRRVVRLIIVAWLLSGTAHALERLPAVVHLHSDLSTGDFSLEQLTAMAEKQGIGALLVTENYLLRVEYGLPPFRALTRAVREERSVLGIGIDRYLTGVAQARAANPRVLIVPGVEVLPHYYWTGSPLTLDMTVHGTQKNMLVFGLDADAQEPGKLAGQPRHAALFPVAAGGEDLLGEILDDAGTIVADDEPTWRLTTVSVSSHARNTGSQWSV